MRAVFKELDRHTDGSGRGAQRSHQQIAAETSLSVSTVQRALGALERAGYIRRHHGCACKQCRRATRDTKVFDVVKRWPALVVEEPSTSVTNPRRRSPSTTLDVGHGDQGSPVMMTDTFKSSSSSFGNAREKSSESEELSQTVEDVLAVLGRVRKPGWLVDRDAVATVIMAWPSRDPRHAAAAVVAGAADHRFVNAANALRRQLEWQREPASSRGGPAGGAQRPAEPAPGKYSDKYSIAMGLVEE